MFLWHKHNFRSLWLLKMLVIANRAIWECRWHYFNKSQKVAYAAIDRYIFIKIVSICCLCDEVISLPPSCINYSVTLYSKHLNIKWVCFQQIGDLLYLVVVSTADILLKKQTNKFQLIFNTSQVVTMAHISVFTADTSVSIYMFSICTQRTFIECYLIFTEILNVFYFMPFKW